MTRTLSVIAQARRITQPLPIIPRARRPLDPSIRRVGFSTFRVHRTGDQFTAIPHIDRRNTMTTFLRLLTDSH